MATDNYDQKNHYFGNQSTRDFTSGHFPTLFGQHWSKKGNVYLS